MESMREKGTAADAMQGTGEELSFETSASVSSISYSASQHTTLFTALLAVVELGRMVRRLVWVESDIAFG
jgi:hypothetical protein